MGMCYSANLPKYISYERQRPLMPQDAVKLLESNLAKFAALTCTRVVPVQILD